MAQGGRTAHLPDYADGDSVTGHPLHNQCRSHRVHDGRAVQVNNAKPLLARARNTTVYFQLAFQLTFYLRSLISYLHVAISKCSV